MLWPRQTKEFLRAPIHSNVVVLSFEFNTIEWRLTDSSDALQMNTMRSICHRNRKHWLRHKKSFVEFRCRQNDLLVVLTAGRQRAWSAIKYAPQLILIIITAWLIQIKWSWPLTLVMCEHDYQRQTAQSHFTCYIDRQRHSQWKIKAISTATYYVQLALFSRWLNKAKHLFCSFDLYRFKYQYAVRLFVFPFFCVNIFIYFVSFFFAACACFFHMRRLFAFDNVQRNWCDAYTMHTINEACLLINNPI